MPEFIDPVFAKTSPKRSFSMTENERFGLDVAKTGSINSGTAWFGYYLHRTMPEFIDPVFAKTSRKRSFSAKTGSINSGTSCIGD